MEIFRSAKKTHLSQLSEIRTSSHHNISSINELPTNMHKYTKWSIAALASWTFFFTVLFGGIIKKTSVFREYACTVEKFSVNPRFECYRKCGVTDGRNTELEKDGNDYDLEYDYDYSYLTADDAFEIMEEFRDLNPYQEISEEEFDDLLQYMEYEMNENKRDHHRDGGDPDKKRPDCDELERDTLDWYSPTLCLHARYGFEDPLCPPESATCYTGRKWRRKCGLSCPLAYNVTLGLGIDHLGYVEKNRDLGTDNDRFNSYKDSYKIGDRITCQVVKGGSGEHEFLFVDERLSHQALQWWKWSLFTGSIAMVILTTAGMIVSYMRYNEKRSAGYDPIIDPGEITAPTTI